METFVVKDKISCVQSLLADFENMFLDPQNSDIVLICQGEQMRAHRVILSARSPVFRAMLQTEMSENVRGEIRIEDAEKEILKEMLRYIYSAKVEETFKKFKELLVLANKYGVDELMKYCGNKVFESLNSDNALEVGIFAELHNAEDLLKYCAKFIIKNRPETLKQDWKEQVKGSPKLMMEILELILDGTGKNKIYEINRGSFDIKHGWAEGRTNAITFQADTKIKLQGIGIFGSNVAEQHSLVTIKVLDDASKCLFEEHKTFNTYGSPIPKKLLFTKPITIEANEKYQIIAVINGGQTYYGVNYKQSLECDVGDKNFVKVIISASQYDNILFPNATHGLIPTLYFSKF